MFLQNEYNWSRARICASKMLVFMPKVNETQFRELNEQYLYLCFENAFVVLVSLKNPKPNFVHPSVNMIKIVTLPLNQVFVIS